MFKQILGFATLVTLGEAVFTKWDTEVLTDPAYIAASTRHHSVVQKTNPLTYAEYLKENANYNPTPKPTGPADKPTTNYTTGEVGVWAIP